MIVDLKGLKEYGSFFGFNGKLVPFSFRENSFMEAVSNNIGILPGLSLDELEYITIPAKNICKVRLPKDLAKTILPEIKNMTDNIASSCRYDYAIAKTRYRYLKNILRYEAVAVCRDGDRFDESLGVSVAMNIWLKHFRDAHAEYMGNVKAITDQYAKATKASLDAFSHFIKAQGKAIDSRIAWNNTCPSNKKHHKHVHVKKSKDGVYRPDFKRR